MSEPEKYLKQPYARILVPEEGGGYSAEILEFPGCFAQGDTPDEAYNNLEEAATAWIQSSLDRGLEIPPPSINAGYGGKVALRLPRSAHRLAVQMAERDGVSLNQFLVSSISARIGAEDLYGRLVQNIQSTISSAISSTITYFQPQIRTSFVTSFPTFVAGNNIFINCQLNQTTTTQVDAAIVSNEGLCLIESKGNP
jgi:antitoxin HicB